MFESTANAVVELRTVMAERLKASMAGDTEKIASSLADEYLQTDIRGYVQDKNAWLNEPIAVARQGADCGFPFNSLRRFRAKAMMDRCQRRL